MSDERARQRPKPSMPEIPSPRLVPHDLQAEMAVLGAMLLGSKTAVATASERLVAGDFYNPLHSHIFETMLEITGRDVDVDFITLANKLDELNTFESGQSSRVYLTQYGDIDFYTRNLPHYAQIVSELSTRRKAIDAANLIAQAAYLGELPLPDFLDEAEKRIFGLRDGRAADGGRDTIQRLMRLETEALDDRQQNLKNGVVTGLPTDFHELDYLMDGGLEDGLLYIVAGRPGMGKTVLGTEILRKILKRASGEVAHFQSLEMNKGQIVRRMLCAEAKICLRKVKSGDLSDAEWVDWNAAYTRLFDGRCIVDDASGLTPLQLKATLRKTRNELGRLDVVVVDYLQLINGGGKTNATKNDEVTHICNSLKEIAKEFQVPVIALSQLSRAVERREDKRPNLSDLRDSGGIEAAADTALLLYRASYYAPKEATDTTGVTVAMPDPVEIIIAKQRDGATGMVKLNFTPEHVRFDSVDDQHGEIQW